MVLATLDLLRQAGWWNAGVNRVVGSSGAPKGSLYHYFPQGKQQLVTEALQQARDQVGARFRAIFGQRRSLQARVEDLFRFRAETLEADGYSRGCPVAAVTLDLSAESQGLQPLCAEILDFWRDAIAEGLGELPARQRKPVAQWILTTLEGALILARAHRDAGRLRQAGRLLGRAVQSLAEQTMQGR
jgi:AcrR family transcriptional regulator